MNLVRIFTITMVLSVWISSALAQVSSEDRVISGNANLSQLDKEAHGGALQDSALRQTLFNSRIYAVIIQQRDTAHGAGGATSKEYWIFYSLGMDTHLHARQISKDDYAWLIQFADRVNQE